MIIRRKRNSAFSIVPNRIAVDPRLTIGARWLMFYLLTKPDHWEVHISNVQEVGAIGRDKAYGLVKECIEARYITRQKHSDGSTTYEVYDAPPTEAASPFPENPDLATDPNPEKPDEGGPDPEKPDLGKPDPEFQDRSKNPESARTETTRHARAANLDLLQLRDAVGDALDRTSTSVMVPTEPLRWLSGGCDLELDVLPTLRAKGRGRRPNSIRAWSFFTDAVIEARDRRLSPLPEAQPVTDLPRRDPYRSRVDMAAIHEMARQIDEEAER